MFDGPRTVEGPGAAMAGPPLSASLSRSGGTSYPGYIYSFHNDDDNRCLYVGKAGAGPSGPGMRIQSHYQNRKPWALEATTIRVQPFPGISDDMLLEVERQRIEQLRPRGNKQANWAHHDRVWMARTEIAHQRANGIPVPLATLIALWWATWVARARRGARMVVQALIVDAVLLVLVSVLWALAR